MMKPVQPIPMWESFPLQSLDRMCDLSDRSLSQEVLAEKSCRGAPDPMAVLPLLPLAHLDVCIPACRVCAR